MFKFTKMGLAVSSLSALAIGFSLGFSMGVSQEPQGADFSERGVPQTYKALALKCEDQYENYVRVHREAHREAHGWTTTGYGSQDLTENSSVGCVAWLDSRKKDQRDGEELDKAQK